MFCEQRGLIHHLMYIPMLWEVWPPDMFLSWKYVTDAVESGKNCIQYGECEEMCPHGLPIREIIEENMVFYNNMKQKNTPQSS